MAEEPYRYRDEHGNLRLDELLGAEHVRHYTRILESSNEEFAAMQLALAVHPADPRRPVPSWAYARQERGTVTPGGWLLAAEGASCREASPCQDLALLPEVCWDVCGYYGRLGVHWKATPREIRLAYLARDPRQEDTGLFYAMSQLLDPVIRRAYDLMPPGGMFMGDRTVCERIEQAAAMEASRQNAEAWLAGEDMTSQGTVLKSWGFDKGIPAGEARERLAGKFRHGSSGDGLGSTLSAWERGWGWYRLSGPDDDVPVAADAALLERWQAMVAQAFRACGLREKFAVGTWPGQGARMWHDSNECCIVFIGKGIVTQHMADMAVQGYAVPVEPQMSQQ